MNIIKLLNKIKLNKGNYNIFENDIKNNYKKHYIDCLKIINNKLEIDDDINIIGLKDNYIMSEFDVNNTKEFIQLLNCYEKAKKEFTNIEGKENEKEISEFCGLYLNEEKIDFCFKHKFQKEGKYYIKIKINKNLTNINYLFFNCSFLTSLNLSNFNTNNVIDSSAMLFNCSSLTSLNLSNFNTNNINNMTGMFGNCSSLIFLNLSSFNTSNVKDMKGMFVGCLSLISLNLLNFNTNNVIDMNRMFYNCSSLISLNLSNFNTNNVIDMNRMFYNCLSLISLNLSNFNTNNVIDMEDIFFGLNHKCDIISNDKKILFSKDFNNI